MKEYRGTMCERIPSKDNIVLVKCDETEDDKCLQCLACIDGRINPNLCSALPIQECKPGFVFKWKEIE